MDERTQPPGSASDAFAMALAALRAQGLEPSTLGDEMRTRILAGELSADQAVATIVAEATRSDVPAKKRRPLTDEERARIYAILAPGDLDPAAGVGEDHRISFRQRALDAGIALDDFRADN